jgi:hypothetical protein
MFKRRLLDELTLYGIQKAIMRIPLLLLLLLVSRFSFSQTTTVIGVICNEEDSSTYPGANILFGKSNGTYSDFSGRFSLTFDKGLLNDTLKIKSFGYRSLYIINIPKSFDTINLGKIPLFQCMTFSYWFDNSLSKDSCNRWFPFKRKNDFMKAKVFTDEVNKSIENYRFKFYNKIYRLKYFGNYKNLIVTLDLSKEENQ